MHISSMGEGRGVKVGEGPASGGGVAECGVNILTAAFSSFGGRLGISFYSLNIYPIILIYTIIVASIFFPLSLKNQYTNPT